MVQIRSALKYFAYTRLQTGLQLLPAPLADRVASAASHAMVYANPTFRAGYREAISHVLGRDLSRHEIRSWTSKVARAYGHYWADGARVVKTSGNGIDAGFRIESGLDHLQAARDAGNGSILALAHLGTWEWGGAYLARHDFPLTSVAEIVEPPKLYEWFVENRRNAGITVYPLDGGAFGNLAAVLRDGRTVALLCDRDIAGTGVEVDFFGDRALLPAGPAVLSLRTGAPILPTAVYHGPGNLRVATIRPAVNYERSGDLRRDVIGVTQRLASCLEALIRRAPEQWYIFSPNWLNQVDTPVRRRGGSARADRSGHPNRSTHP